MPQKFYNVISTLHRNVTVGPGRCIIPGVTMGEHTCSSFFIKNDNGSEVCSPVNSLREISECYCMSQSLYYLHIPLVQALVGILFEPKRSIG